MTRPPLPPQDRSPDDWSDLAEVWTAPREEPDLTADLVRRMRRRAALARLNFHFEAWGCVAAGAVGAWFAFTHAAPLMGLGAMAFGLFALAVTLWARRGAEPGAAATPREALRAAIAQARSGLRWARAGQAVTAAAGLFLAVAAFEAGAFKAPWFFAPAVVFLVLSAAFYERHARRAKTRVAGHEAAMRDLDG